jgi:putative YphP/YqiW family bacilliredoxin
LPPFCEAQLERIGLKLNLVDKRKIETMYPEFMVAPMRRELTEVGFEELKSSTEVDSALGKPEGTVLIMVNSVCGCAAGNARPAVRMAVQSEKRPDKLTTVFAGMEREAVEKAREYMAPYPPSSPMIALFKGGELVHMIERRNIEGSTADMIAKKLQEAFEQYC